MTESRPSSSTTPSAVMRAAVAGHRVAHAVDRRGRSARSCPRRRGSRAARGPLGQPARGFVAGLQDLVRSSSSMHAAGAGVNVPVDAPTPSSNVAELAAGLRRADAVDEHQLRDAVEELLLERGAERGATLSATLKEEFLERVPQLMLVDGVGSSEAGGQLSHVSTQAVGRVHRHVHRRRRQRRRSTRS